MRKIALLLTAMLSLLPVFAQPYEPEHGLSYNDRLRIGVQLVLPATDDCSEISTWLQARRYDELLGAICYDSDDQLLMCYNGGSWAVCGGGGTSGIQVDGSGGGSCSGKTPRAVGDQCYDVGEENLYYSPDNASWQLIPKTTPAGVSTELQYRNGSSLGATDATYTAPTSTAPSVLTLAGDLKSGAGYNLSGDSQGVQFFPGRRRAAALAVSAKKRGDTKFIGPTSSGVLIIGDSIMAVTSQATWRIWDEKFNSFGLGYDPIADSDIYHSNFVLKTETFSGTWTVKHVGSVAGATAPANAREWGINGSSVVADSADDTLLYSVAAPVRFNRVRIWYAKTPGGGTFEWRVNGGSWTAVNTDNPTLDAGYPISGDTDCINLSAGILTQNTIEVRWSSGGAVTFYGIETFSKESGGDRVEFNNVVPYWVTAGGQALYGTATSFDSYAHSNVPLQTFIRTTKPSQIVITLGANDGCYGGIAGGCSNFTTPDNYEAALRRVITSIEGYWDANNKGDIVVATALPRGTYGSATEHAAFAARADEYRVRIFKVARDTGISVWDLRRFWPDFASQDQAGLNLLEDGTHPGPTGKALLAHALAAWIGNAPWQGTRTNGIYCGQYGLTAGAVTWPECTFGDIYSSSGTLNTINSCDQRLNKGRSIEVFCTSTAGWDIDADSTAGNVRAGADFVCGANKAIRLTCDGVNWRETGRSFATTTATTYLCETFGLANNPANATTYFFGSDGGSVYYWPVPIAGTLSSMACTNNAQLSAGSGTITAIRYDGTLDATDLTVSYTTTETAPTKKSDTACTSNCTVASTDMVAVRIAADATYAPTTADWACTVCMTVP